MTVFTATPSIVVERLRRSFGGHDVLREVSFRIDRGETVALLGANGGGKTTLVEILATLLAPSSGRASIEGYDVVRQGASVRRTIGYCLSNLRSHYPRLSGRRNLEFFAALYGLDRNAARTRIAVLLEQLGLADAAAERVERYSDGMRARLGLARALLTDPPVLLLDEPTKSVDPAFRVEVRALLQSRIGRQARRTMLWVTHDLDEAAAVSDRVMELADGVVRERRTTARQAAAR